MQTLRTGSGLPADISAARLKTGVDGVPPYLLQFLWHRRLS